MAPWDINPDAIESADRHYVETLALPDLRGLTEGLRPAAGPRSRQWTPDRGRPTRR